ncbi:MAG: FAD:protein FMN transferase [Firmicutes bacterium]|nr:FAD:protein FMN transferase [Bacillota bacterium]
MKKFSAKKVLLALALIVTLIIPQMGCASNGQNTNTGVSKTGFYLDTVCGITIYGMADPDGSLAALSDDDLELHFLKVITDAFLVCSDYEKVLSKTIETSDISRINNADGEATEVSREAIEIIEKGLHYGELSGGAFDITIGKATDLWDFHDNPETGHEGGQIPSQEALNEAVSHVDYKAVQVDGNRVKLTDSDAEINLGGIAKGYIADKVASYLEERGVTSAVVDLGGNIVVIGGKSGNLLCGDSTEPEQAAPFKIGIADPASKTGDLLGILPCTDKTVVTSGTYERYFEQDGVKYHHILDPKTGYPVDTDVLSVTIISDRGNSADCDGLSTTCLALGMEKGLELVKGLDGFEAIFVDLNGNVEMTSTETGFQLNK